MNGSSWSGMGGQRPHGSSYQTTDGLEILTPPQQAGGTGSGLTRHLYLVLAVGLLTACVVFGLLRQHHAATAAARVTIEETPPPPTTPLVTPPVAPFESPIDPSASVIASPSGSNAAAKKIVTPPATVKKAPPPTPAKPKAAKVNIPRERP